VTCLGDGSVAPSLGGLVVDGSSVPLSSIGTHEVWATLMSPHRGATLLTKIQLFTGTIKHC